MLTMAEKIILPPRYTTFTRQEWFLLFDPVNVVWIRVNPDGKKILDSLKTEGTIAGVCRAFAKEYPTETMENIARAIAPYIRNLVDVGFLHVGEYQLKKRDWSFNDVPDNIYLMMSAKCNIKCRYCYNLEDRHHLNEMSQIQPEAELSLVEYQ